MLQHQHSYRFLQKHSCVRCLAEVAAKELVRDAKAAARATPCPVLARLSSIRLCNADAPLYKTLWEFGLTLGIQIRTARVGATLLHPYLDPGEFLRHLGAKGFLHKVIGVPVDVAEEGLRQYWETFRKIYPTHAIYRETVDLGRVIPYYLHGDGGRGFKKDPIEIISMLPCLGSGTNKNPVNLSVPKRRQDGNPTMGINMRGNSGATRFLFSVLSSLTFKSDPAAFDSLISLWGQKLKSLFVDGFEAGGVQWRVAIVAFTGDSPFVKKVAHLNRSFNNVRKNHTSVRDQKGCCWLCLAGKQTREEHIPFEELGFTEPRWIATQGANNRPLPWSGTGGPLLPHMMVGDDAPAFFRPDLFHIFHAGVGKDFIGSSLVYCMKVLFGLGSIRKDLEALNLELKEFSAVLRPASTWENNLQKIIWATLGHEIILKDTGAKIWILPS